MEKAIYGLAMPFFSHYVDYDSLTNTFILEKGNQKCIEINGLIPATLSHDWEKIIGLSDSNLNVKINKHGVFFKLIPDSPLGMSAYKKVKNGAIRHCSISYIVRKCKENVEAEKRLELLACLMCNDIVVKEYTRIEVQEIGIGNHPKNPDTFCTTDPHDPRLKEVRWDETC